MALAQRYLILGFLALGVAGGASCAWAQASGGPVREVRFTVFADGLLRGISFTPAPREDPKELQFLSSQRSPVYTYRGPSPIVFESVVKLPPEPGRPGTVRVERVVVARAQIPFEVNDALLLFSIEPGWEHQNPRRYLVQVFDDGARRLPVGHLAFLNATGVPLFGNLGAQEIQCPVGLSRAFRVGVGESPVRLSVYQDGEVIPVYGDLIPLGTGQRVTVVLFPPSSPESFNVRRCLLYDPRDALSIPRSTSGAGT